MPHIAENTDWLNKLNDNEPFVRLEKSAHNINMSCKRARELLEIITVGMLPVSRTVNLIEELRSFDQEVVSWRQVPEWSFINLVVSEHPELEAAAQGITDIIQLHPDVWMAYEWNYHRAARIIFLQQLLQCAITARECPDLGSDEDFILSGRIDECTSTIQWLTQEILSTVPQSLGDVDHMGWVHNYQGDPPRCRAIGGYLLLWPIRIIKSDSYVTTSKQKTIACKIFERIRDCTGMKDALGDKSSV
jgi:hypothetical protein